MSLVGTRPILPDELEQYELHHRARVRSLSSAERCSRMPGTKSKS